MTNVYVVAAVRTAIGKFGGSLSTVSAADLGAVVIREVVDRAGIEGTQIDEVIMGNVFQAGGKGNPARQAAVKAGLPIEIPAMTINKLCGSAMRAISVGAQIIMAGDADVIVAGGMESMSRVPYLLPDARWGYRMNNGKLEDALLHDGLVCAFHDYHMGVTAENLAEKYSVSRQDQDEFSYHSQQKAVRAINEGRFKEEIVPVLIPQKKGNPVVFEVDEHPSPNTTLEGLAKLKAAFKSGGSVTAGNASGLNDAASAVVLMSEAKVKETGVTPLGRVVSSASAGVDPSIMGFGPVPATKKALAKAGLSVSQINLIEANEAFASQALVVQRTLELDPEIVNVNGGAIALGHPVGSTGARIVTTLLYEMARRKVQYGLTTMCIGGGQGSTIIFERI